MEEIQIIDKVATDVLTVNVSRIFNQKDLDSGNTFRVKGIMGSFTDAQLKDLGVQIAAYFAAPKTSTTTAPVTSSAQ